MIKPTLALLVFATLLSSLLSSSMAATLPVEAGSRGSGSSSSSHAAHPPLAPSSRVRKAAAAGIPHEERKLIQLGPFCFAFAMGGMPSPVSCDKVSCLGPVCVSDEGTAKSDGSSICEGTSGFMVAKPNLEQCVWTYACCY